jgi:hypothetical protein
MAHSPDTIQVKLDLKVPMRDGVLLSADLYRPSLEGRFPTLLCRTIYDNQQLRYVEWAVRFVRAGYAVVIQDCRGRYDSDGTWDPYVCEAEDGYDTQQWVGQQPWCDGTIGTFGISYVGFTQILPAPFRSPYVKGLVPIAHQEDNFGHVYVDGVLQLQNALNFAWIGSRTVQSHIREVHDFSAQRWRLPLIEALDDLADRPIFRHFVSHPTFDDYWQSYSMKTKYPEVDVPALFITGWYDNLLHEDFKVFQGWRQQARSEATRRTTKLVVGPWTHRGIGSGERIGDVDFGPAAGIDLLGLHLRWYDRRLRGFENGIDDEPPLRIFVMGANVWRDEWEWPLARTRFTPYYLHSGGHANSLFGDGALSTTAPAAGEPADRYDYDPASPVPTLGGQSMVESPGPLDRRPVERRDDVLVYTTEVLEQDVEVTGPIEMILYAASSAVDTDFAATLVDVHPNGLATNVCEGIQRARFRESLERPSLIEPGRSYEYRVVLWETSTLFRAGHRIRLEVTSSNFPRFDRNLNSGEALATGTHPVVAHQTILHAAEHPSRLVLPIIPAES